MKVLLDLGRVEENIIRQKRSIARLKKYIVRTLAGYSMSKQGIA